MLLVCAYISYDAFEPGYTGINIFIHFNLNWKYNINFILTGKSVDKLLALLEPRAHIDPCSRPAIEPNEETNQLTLGPKRFLPWP